MKTGKWIAMMAVVVLAMPWAMTRAQEQAAPAPAAQVVPADQQATDAQLDKLFDVMRIKQQMKATMTMMPQLIRQQISGQMKEMEKDHPELSGMDTQKRQAADQIMQKFMTQAMAVYTPDEMLADMKAIYRRHLTRDDVEGITAFYSSPAGQHMLDMIPVIMQEYMPVVMEKTQAKLKPLMLEMQKELTELQGKSGRD